MNTESFTELSQDKQVQIYQGIHQFLVGRGFNLLDFQDKQSDGDAIELSVVENERQEEAMYAASFRKDYKNGHYMNIHTTFDQGLQEFTKTGRVGILVKRPSKEEDKNVRFQVYFNREGDLLTHIVAITTYLDVVLSNPPKDTIKKPMVLVREKGDPDIWYFLGSNGEKVDLFDERFFKLKGISPKVAKEVRDIMSTRSYYRVNKDPQSGHIRDIKEKRTAKRPENEIPTSFDQ